MVWIKLTHVNGSDYINLDQVYKITRTAELSITFYDSNSILPTTYTFANINELKSALMKFERLVNIVDLDKLAIQHRR